ncbi:Alpha/Beta hydrolase protein [Xylaria sp. FL1777]|nr:Alpha/Beta hydrolase protein [Xylaria sp. FL1777]
MISHSSLSDTTEPICGIKILHERHNAKVDLVFVHGITGHKDHTWSADQSEPWPKTLLPPRIPEARVLTFGYDSSVIGFWSGISGNSIAEHSNNLLSALSCFRSDDEFRPIIFIAHSLGGLVVKDTLLSSRTSPELHLRRILACTRAILFLGTPHHGVDLADIGERLVGFAGLRTARTSQRIVGALRRDSEVLSRIQKGFQELLRSQHKDGTRALEITCFYEELPLMGMAKVVPSESAILDGYLAIGIHADHWNIARFSSADDPGFIRVLGELRRWINQLADVDDEHDERVWDVERTRSSNFAAIKRGEDGEMGGSEDGGFTGGAITIWGNVTNSVITNGNHIIQGNLVFGRSGAGL